MTPDEERRLKAEILLEHAEAEKGFELLHVEIRQWGRRLEKIGARLGELNLEEARPVPTLTVEEEAALDLSKLKALLSEAREGKEKLELLGARKKAIGF